MLDSLSDTTFALLLLGVMAVSVALSFPLMDGVKRHLEFFRLFRATAKEVERRQR